MPSWKLSIFQCNWCFFSFQNLFRFPPTTTPNPVNQHPLLSMSKLDHSKLVIRPYWLDSNKALVKIVDKTFICFIYQVLLVRIQLGWKKIFCFVLKKQKWWYSHSQWVQYWLTPIHQWNYKNQHFHENIHIEFSTSCITKKIWRKNVEI